MTYDILHVLAYLDDQQIPLQLIREAARLMGGQPVKHPRSGGDGISSSESEEEEDSDSNSEDDGGSCSKLKGLLFTVTGEIADSYVPGELLPEKHSY